MTDLTSLIAQVEGAGGPDRALDADIYLAIYGDRKYGVLTGNKHQYAGPAYLSDYVEQYRDLLTADDALHDDVVPRYSTSIDAAMSLVPEGWGWTVGDKAPDPSIAWCEIDHLPWHDGYGWAVERKLIVEAATPALALCAAALKARNPQ